METNAVIFFDDTCILCSRSVRWIYRHDVKKILHFASVTSDLYNDTVMLRSDYIPGVDSIVFMIDNRLYFRSDAVMQIVKRLRFPIPLLQIFMLVPRRFRDRIYDWIARKRYQWFGKRSNCIIPGVDLKGRVVG
ncbi:thiol-disulfide oxidoreductase DCC family protein [Bacteroidota bacterium]